MSTICSRFCGPGGHVGSDHFHASNVLKRDRQRLPLPPQTVSKMNFYIQLRLHLPNKSFRGEMTICEPLEWDPAT